MAMGALNTGAASWMWDWEDAGGDYKDQLYQAWENLRDLLAHKWNDKPYLHPTKKEGGKPRQGLRVVVDRRADVLLLGGELVRDLLVERVGEGLIRHTQTL